MAGLPRLRLLTVPSGRLLYRVYNSTWGHDEFNPGFGDARFSPVDHPVTGERVATMYLAAEPTSTMLETVFRDVHHDSDRLIYEHDLVGTLLAYVRVPAAIMLGDLRDPQLKRLGLQRGQVVSSASEHYPCTRRLAVQALAQRGLRGLIWHSRQAELAGADASEVLVIFGDPRTARRGSWTLAVPGIRHLYEGPGRLLIDQLAEDLGAVVVTG